MSEVKYPGICQHKHGVDQTNMSLDYTNTDVAHDALEAQVTDSTIQCR